MDVDSLPSKEPTRCEELWFADCGLVIRAENTVFRVSRDVLAFHSSVFRDMLALPNDVDDIEYFLKALIHYDFFKPKAMDNPFEVVAGVLRISHKYDVPALRKRALHLITAVFPTKLSDVPNNSRARQSWHEWTPSMEVVVSLARKLSLDWILPFAFYELCRTSHELDILTSDELSVEDKHRWAKGSARLTVNWNSAILDSIWNPLYIDGCKFPSICLEQRVIARKDAEMDRAYDTDAPRYPLNIYGETSLQGLCTMVCSVCSKHIAQAFSEARQEFWVQLPAVFNLPSWEVLEKMKLEALEGNM
ncbi:hypothetical protein HMN09_00724600 [Mycena chlorophos]|uniref:BTB domain-containing protein n=1 Tax=Mycena chlorophos TaxID=658473 RepID=A0A8H6STS9_MYCCL|nr:hypothetical protein HMN09_00724600 [Mycena chlorophos]